MLPPAQKRGRGTAVARGLGLPLIPHPQSMTSPRPWAVGSEGPPPLHTQGAGHSSRYHSEPGPGPELLTAVPASQTHPDAYLALARS